VASEALLTLTLNGAPIAETGAGRVANANGDARADFVFRVDEVWPHLGAGDRLQVLVDGSPIPFENGTDAYVHDQEGESRSSELLARIAEGYIFTKTGTLKKSLTENEKWKSSIFSLFEEVRAALKAEFNVDLMITYGTLLGCVREGGFIKQDDDFDTAYVSRHTEPEAVRQEALDIIHFLIKNDYAVAMGSNPNLFKVRRRGAKSGKIDIFYSWFAKGGEYQISYGHHGQRSATRADFEAMETRYIEDQPFSVPKGSDNILRQFYGDTWRTPDQGFSHYAKTRKIDPRYFFTKQDREKVYWSNFYHVNKLSQASTFAQFMSERIAPGAFVLDFGCGTGKDAIFFGKHEHATIGFDASVEGIARANEMKVEHGLENCRFRVVDAASPDCVEAVRSAVSELGNGARERVIYMRFFLHSVTEAVEDNILDALRDGIDGPFTLAAEFRAVQDEMLPKVFGVSHFRRYLEPEALIRKLTERYGMRILHHEEGHGLSVYKEEDPHLCRLIAVRD
jgi:SAM-dependent methyltransferase